MEDLKLLAALCLIIFIGCGGGSPKEEQAESSTNPQVKTLTSKVRTIDIIGIDNLQFTVKKKSKKMTVGDSVGNDKLFGLETIIAQPSEKIQLRLTTQSTLSAAAMAHNWVLVTLRTDADGAKGKK